MGSVIEMNNKKSQFLDDSGSEDEGDRCGDGCDAMNLVLGARKELEECLFNENNKINNSVKQLILKLFCKVEKAVQDISLNNIKLTTEKARIETELRDTRDKVNVINQTYAQVAVGNSSNSVPSQVNQLRRHHQDYKVIVKPRNGDNFKDSENVKKLLLKEL